MATGAVVSGVSLEAIGRIRASTRLAIVAGIAFAASILVFALSRSYPLSIAALVVAGGSSLIAASTSTTIVQLEAPPDRRGRFVGAAGMTAHGFQAGSGILIGLLAGGLGVAGGVSVAATALLVCAGALLVVVAVRRRATPSIDPGDDAPVELEA
jgi:MFS family permease